ncbi:MAG TPA: UDP-N-acetylglucosamine 2-epimerase (non-hydrolyzing) [Gemmatimonadales bacterium]|jgi:UDP-N-acetylglucosamine 2-epimerase (non-hydrolysing)|nr:UDP-N-acetylglucosamine 2-epimerase (non-hydrolyzing) [Gemmatimonadales bacterium]
MPLTPDRKHRIAIVLGTRPEAIKMAPVIQELRRRADEFETIVITTSQQREMLTQALHACHIEVDPDHDLGLTHANQTLANFTAHALLKLTEKFRVVRPDMLLVQGDTSTVIAAALAAFYNGVPIGHVEAGLRSGDSRRPFPEEVNRRMASCVTDIHFAPTERARRNLLAERVADEHIYVTGNTIVDALAALRHDGVFDDPALNRVAWDVKRVVLATVHRRENLGQSLRNVCAAFRRLVEVDEGLEIVFPVHLNPLVRETVHAELRDVPGITLLEPLEYADLIEVMRRSALVLTDSGGIQEEAPAMHKPVLILRSVTERPEVLESGFGQLVGTDRDAIVEQTLRVLRNPAVYRAMTSGENPFGDGHAAERIVNIIAERFRTGRLFAAPVVESPVPQH